ncbi:MAG: hypothetical protein QOD93_3444 [Acetobacteraceae bacterium]|nr:hypothetical protein [Acetobacteraceae bacterium]
MTDDETNAPRSWRAWAEVATCSMDPRILRGPRTEIGSWTRCATHGGVRFELRNLPSRAASTASIHTDGPD